MPRELKWMLYTFIALVIGAVLYMTWTNLMQAASTPDDMAVWTLVFFVFIVVCAVVGFIVHFVVPKREVK